MPTIKVKNIKTGEWQKLPTLKGDKGEPGVQGLPGEDYILTEEDKEEIANITKPLVEEAIQPTIEGIKETSERAETIAKGRATGYVFDTLEDLELWLQDSENISKLVLGDNFYIRALNTPDYWWDGEQKQQLETQKVDLTGYVKNTDYASNSKFGLVQGSTGYGVAVWNGTPTIQSATNENIDAKTNAYKPIVPSNLDYAVGSVFPVITQAEYDELVANGAVNENLYYCIVEEE